MNLLCGLVTSEAALAQAAIDERSPGHLRRRLREAHPRGIHPNYFRVTDQTYMRNRAQARLMAERYPEVTKWGALIPDNG